MEYRCKICGKLAEEDAHFYKTKMLCNKHYIQMYRYGKIIDTIPRGILKRVCVVCGDTKSCRYQVWHGGGEYDGQEVCSKHYTQLRNKGKILDSAPTPHINVEDRACDVCGSTHHVIYHNGRYYCLRHYSQIKNLGGLRPITVFDRNEYDTDGDITYIYIRNGKNERIATCKIDTEDLDRIIKHKWSLGTWGYASAMLDGNSIMMQRYILGVYDKKDIVDHINRDPLDNRKSNLRIVNKSLNSINTGLRANNVSGVTGVSWSNSLSHWRAYINYDGERIELGYFDSFEEAVTARLMAENKYYAGLQPQIELFEKYGVKIENGQ